MGMDMVTQVTVLERPVLSRAHIVNVTTASVRRDTFIVKDMAMVEDMVSQSKKLVLEFAESDCQFTFEFCPNFRQKILLWKHGGRILPLRLL